MTRPQARLRVPWSLTPVFALSLHLVACAADADLAATPEAAPAASAQRTPWEPPGLPSYHKPPHAQAAEKAGSAARLPEGYRYAQGQFDDGTSYSLYSYVDSSWTYMSSYIWGQDGSSLSSGMSSGASGEIWNQASAYDYLEDGSMAGDYFTSYVDASGVATVYLSEFTSTATSSVYRSTVDYSNTSASPDCDYYGEWSGSTSSGYQMCVRPDESFWSCSYEYSSSASAEGTGSQYSSSESCDDSRTTHAPDYSYTSETEWDYNTGAYTNYAAVSCYDEAGSLTSFTYVYENGVGGWYDASGAEVSYPTCSFSYY